MLEAVLKKIPFFSHMGSPDLFELEQSGQVVTVPADTYVFHQGDLAEHLYVILQGSVQVASEETSELAEYSLSILNQGDFFGEIALADGGTRSASIITLEDCQFFTLSREQFMQLLGKSSHLLSDVIAAISRKVRSSNQQIYQQMLAQQHLLMEQESAKNRALGRMVAGVTQELNTPLGILNATSSLISERLDDLKILGPKDALKEIKESLALMQKNTERMHWLIESFKSVSVDQQAEQAEELDLIEFLQDLTEQYGIFGKHNLEMTLKLPDSACPWFGYPNALHEVFMHLFSNIEQHAYPTTTDASVTAPRVTITLEQIHRRKQDMYLLSVADQGTGMSSEHLKQVFDAFFTTRRIQGQTGLGLAIVYNLVTILCEGQIEVDSIPGQGSIFHIYLPLKVPQENSGIHP